MGGHVPPVVLCRRLRDARQPLGRGIRSGGKTHGRAPGKSGGCRRPGRGAAKGVAGRRGSARVALGELDPGRRSIRSTILGGGTYGRGAGTRVSQGYRTGSGSGTDGGFEAGPRGAK